MASSMALARFALLRYVVVPMVKPALIFVTIRTFMVNRNEFFLVLAITTEESMCPCAPSTMTEGDRSESVAARHRCGAATDVLNA